MTTQQIEDKFTVLHDDNASFIDLSEDAKDFGRDSFSLPLVAAEDYLYIGLYKQFYFFYVELATANTVNNTFSAEYFDENDSNWKTLEIIDETKGFTRSGFIQWKLPTDENGNHVWERNIINSEELYWVRFKPSLDLDGATALQGLAIVFSNDRDIIEERGNIVSKYAVNEPTGTWVLKHQAARKDIVSALRRAGYRKFGPTIIKQGEDDDARRVGRYKQITEFDLLDFGELRQASKYLVLAKIFRFELSDTEEDKFEALGLKYEQMYEQELEQFYLSLDKDDDGRNDLEEQAATTAIHLVTT